MRIQNGGSDPLRFPHAHPESQVRLLMFFGTFLFHNDLGEYLGEIFMVVQLNALQNNTCPAPRRESRCAVADL